MHRTPPCVMSRTEVDEVTARPPSVEVRCRHCDAAFTLADLLAERTGRCPNCNVLLAPEWTEVLFEEAARVEESQAGLITGYRRLAGLPGFLEVLPHTLIQNFFEEVGWEEQLSADPELVERELRLLRQELMAWEHLLPRAVQHERAATVRKILSRVGHLSHLVDPEGAPKE
jgi:hypothetical protein